MVSLNGNELNKFKTGYGMSQLDRIHTAVLLTTYSDPIMAQAVPILRQHDVSTYHRFLANMRIASTTSAAASANSGIKFYTFLERGAVGRTVPLQLSGGSAKVCHNPHFFKMNWSTQEIKTVQENTTVEVRVGGAWVKLAAWLNNLPTYFVDRLKDRGYSKQFKWWSKNGKTFDFMKLPPELREHLYLQFLGPAIYPEFPSRHLARPLGHPNAGFFACVGKQMFDNVVLDLPWLAGDKYSGG